MGDDDNQKQVERVLSRTVPEVEIPCREPGGELDVGEPTLHVAGPMEEQPVPTVRVDRQAQEPDLEWVQEQVKQTQMIMKRNVSESQRAEARKGKARM